MASINEKLLHDALSLPVDQRTTLIDKLLESLNIPLRKEIEKQWAIESDCRYKEIKSGKIENISGEKVFQDIRERLKN
jgi:putative addiction module component (TIGR02574 family)